MLQLIPKVKITTTEKCSGHGGSFGVMKETHASAMKVGGPVFTKIKREITKDKEKGS